MFDQAIEDGKVVHDGTGWQMNGCCGQCFLVSHLQFCWHCGTRLPATPPEKKTATKPVAAKEHMTPGKTQLRVHGQMSILEIIERVKADGN